MADKENKKEEVKKEEKEKKQEKQEVKKEENVSNEKTEKKVKTEVKKEDKKPENKEEKKEEKKLENKEVKQEENPENKEAKQEKKTTEVKTEKKEEAKPETKKFEVSKQNSTVKKENKKVTNKKSIVPTILTVIIVLAIVALLTVLIVTSSDPKKSIDGFLTNLKAGDFTKAQEFVIGDDILEEQQYSVETQKLLVDKISWKVKKTTVENDKAKAEVEITNKDFSIITANCMKKMLSNLKAVLQGNVSNNDIEKYFVEELKSDNVQMKTDTKTIELQKQDGKWKVVSNEELTKTLLPGLDEAVNALQ